MDCEIEEKVSEGKEYWRKKMQCIQDYAVLLKDYKGVRLQSIKEYTFAFSDELSSKLIKKSKGNKMVLFIYLLSGFHILLHKVTQKDCILVSTPVYGESEFNDLVFMVQVFHENWNYKEVIKEVFEDVKSAYQNQFIPFSDVGSENSEKRSVNLCQYLMTFDGIHTKEKVTSVLELSRTEFALSLREEEGKLLGQVLSDSSKIESETVHAYLRCYQQIMTDMFANLESSETYTKTRNVVKVPKDTLGEFDFQQLLSKIALNNNRQSVITENGYSISLQELNQRASKLATSLQSKKVGKGVTVSVCVEDSISAIIGACAVTITGGNFVIISPQLTEEKKRFLQTDSCASIQIEKDSLESEFRVSELLNDCKSCEESEDTLCKAYKVMKNGKFAGIEITRTAFYEQVSVWKEIVAKKDRYIKVGLSTTLNPRAPLWVIQMFMMEYVEIVTIPEQTLYNLNGLEQFVQENEINLLILPAFCAKQTLTMRVDSLHNIILLGLVDNMELYRNCNSSYHYTFVMEKFEYYPIIACYDVDAYKEESMWIPLKELPEGCRLFVCDKEGNQQESLIPGELIVTGTGLANGYIHNDSLTKTFYSQTPIAENIPCYHLYIKARKNSRGTYEIYRDDLEENDIDDYVSGEDVSASFEMDEVKRQLYSIWKMLLGDKIIREKDKFLEIGGDSTLLLRMVAEVEKLYPGAISVVDAFSNPTIKELSQFIYKKQESVTLKEVGYEQVQRYAIELPEAYFATALNKDKNYVTLVFDFGEEECESLFLLSKRWNLPIEAIILTEYLHTLADIALGKEVSMYFICDEDEAVSAVEVVKEEKYEAEYRRRVEKAYQSPKIHYHLCDLDEKNIKKDGKRIVSLFYSMELYQFNQEILSVYDMVIGVSVSDDEEITLIYRFNSSYLNEELCKNILKKLIGRMNQKIDQEIKDDLKG